MIKIVLLAVAICLAVTSGCAQNVQADFVYRGSADCSDASKVISVRVFAATQCNPISCVLDKSGLSTVTRCYNTFADVPLPSNTITLNTFSTATCTGNATFAEFIPLGLTGCSAVNTADSLYFTACSSTSSGAMHCNGSLDCSSGCATSPIYTGNEGDCSSASNIPPGYTYSCKVDFSRLNAPTPPATPARKSSATQVISNVFGLISIIIIALVSF